MRVVTGVRDLTQRTRDGQAQIGYSVAVRLRGRETMCAVCTVHKETRSAYFLVWPQNQGRRFPQFGLKTGGFGFSILGLKTGSYSLEIWISKSPR
jgi:hypothetical protein